MPVDKRLHRRLVDLADLCGDGGDGPSTIPLAQEELAQLTGTTGARRGR